MSDFMREKWTTDIEFGGFDSVKLLTLIMNINKSVIIFCFSFGPACEFRNIVFLDKIIAINLFGIIPAYLTVYGFGKWSLMKKNSTSNVALTYNYCS